MDEQISERLGSMIAQLRREAGMTQEDVADESGLSTNFIGMVERGERNATVVAASKIAKALGIKLSAILEKIGE